MLCSSWNCINDVHQCLSETVSCIVTVINARWLLVRQGFESGMKRNTGTKKIPVHELKRWKEIYLNHILHDKTLEEPKERNSPKLLKLSVVMLCVAPCEWS